MVECWDTATEPRQLLGLLGDLLCAGGPRDPKGDGCVTQGPAAGPTQGKQPHQACRLQVHLESTFPIDWEKVFGVISQFVVKVCNAGNPARI